MMLFDRDAAPVILDGDGAIRVNNHAHAVGITCHHLVYTVVNNFIDQVMQAALVGRANIHTGTHPHRFQTFKNLYILLTIIAVAVAIYSPVPTTIAAAMPIL